MAKRDLINITDLDLDELDRLLALASDIIESPENIRINVLIRHWRHCSMNQVHVRGSASNLQCMDLEAMWLGSLMLTHRQPLKGRR